MTWTAGGALLAPFGAVAHHRRPPPFQVGISALGNLMITGFAIGLAGALIQAPHAGPCRCPC